MLIAINCCADLLFNRWSIRKQFLDLKQEKGFAVATLIPR